MSLLKLMCVSLFLGNIAMAETRGAYDVGIFPDFQKALENRVLTMDHMSAMLKGQLSYEEYVGVFGQNETGEIGYVHVEGKQRTLLHQDCLVKWSPIFQRFAQANDVFLRSIGVAKTRLYMSDETKYSNSAMVAGISVNQKSVLMLLVKIDAAEACDGPSDDEMKAALARWREFPAVKNALRQTASALDTLQKLSESGRDFSDELLESLR